MQNLTPADVCFGKGQTILLERERNPTRKRLAPVFEVCGWRLETSWVAKPVLARLTDVAGFLSQSPHGPHEAARH
jgi:hypothetical protein